MRKLKLLSGILLAAFALSLAPGCKTTPDAAAYKVQAASTALVERSMQSWAVYYTKAKAGTIKTDLNDLEQTRAKIDRSYGRWQQAMELLDVARATYKAGIKRDLSADVKTVSDCASELETIITTSTKQ